MRKITLSVIETIMGLTYTAHVHPLENLPVNEATGFIVPTKKEVKTKVEVCEWLSKKNEKGFLENRGQMIDMNRQLVPFVLFKAELPGLNLWITETGVTLQTMSIEKEDSHKKGKRMEKRKEMKYEEFIQDEEKNIHNIYWERIDIELRGANIKKENIFKEQFSPQGYFNYFYPHCPDGIYGVKEYSKITIKNVYPGIDWVWYSHSQKGYKYDFVVHAGADYKNIQLVYKSKKPLKINDAGELELYTKYGNIKEYAPLSLYDSKEIKTNFKQLYQKPIIINGDKGYETVIGFDITTHLTIREKDSIIIDPQLFWATFYGGNGVDGPMSIDVDGSGDVFVIGYTSSTNFPIQNAGTFFQGAFASGGYDVFILKFDNMGNRLWATYYGGSWVDWGFSVITDGGGNVFVTGYTNSTDFPVQNAGTFFQGTNAGSIDVFILKFNNAGTRLWATYYGGNWDDYGYSIIMDGSWNMFVIGRTNSTNFPVQNAGTFFQGANAGNNDIFILKFDNAGNRLWATYYGGSRDDESYSISTDSIGNIFVTGRTNSTDFPVQNAGTFFQGTGANNLADFDAFILKFDNAGNRLWATYYGGSWHDGAYSIDVDSNGNVFVMGYTTSNNFPIQNTSAFFQGTLAGGMDAFILKFDNMGNRLWATYYGGIGNEYNYNNTYKNLAVDNCGNVYVSFETNSNPFPWLQYSCVAGYYDSAYNGGIRDIILSMFSNNGVLLWCTYFAGNGDDFRSSLAVDINNNLLIAGEWTTGPAGTIIINNTTYPLTNLGGGAYFDSTFNGGLDDGFIAKFYAFVPITLTSAPVTNNQTVCINTPVTNITYTSGCVTGFTVTGLPAGVVSSFNVGTITISGMPIVTGTFIYTVALIGEKCSTSIATGIIDVQSCTGINEINQNKSFAIYPHPNNGQFTIETERGGVFELMDVMGKVINVYEVKESKAIIQENLPAGFYFIREKNTGAVSKLVIEQ